MRLMEIKVEKRLRSLDEVLRNLLGMRAREKPQKAAPVAPEEGESSSGAPVELEPQPSQPQAAAVTSKDQPPQSMGTDAKKRKWSFCPQCLNMYDFQGKCPYCGVDLIPLDTDENKKLYLKLKQERGGK
jgi:hypothetical protein